MGCVWVGEFAVRTHGGGGGLVRRLAGEASGEKGGEGCVESYLESYMYEESERFG